MQMNLHSGLSFRSRTGGWLIFKANYEQMGIHSQRHEGWWNIKVRVLSHMKDEDASWGVWPVRDAAKVISLFFFFWLHWVFNGFSWWLRWQRICLHCRRPRFDPWVGQIPWRKAVMTHSSILTWRLPWAEEAGRLQSTGSQRVRHAWVNETGFSLLCIGLLANLNAWASHGGIFSCCGAQTQEVQLMGWVASWDVGSSWTRDGTHVPCNGRQILSHQTTRGVLLRNPLVTLADVLDVVTRLPAPKD